MDDPRNFILDILQDNTLNFNEDGSLLLHFAVCLPTTEIALRMIQNGADINKRNLYGYSALHRAVQYNNPQHVQLLLQHDADVTLKTEDDYTPLFQNSRDKQESGQSNRATETDF